MNVLNRLQITWRAAQDIKNDQVVDLGFGLLQSENGVIGDGPPPHQRVQILGVCVDRVVAAS